MNDRTPSPPLLADSRGLDFLNTLWIPVDAEVEGLADGEGLLAWLKDSALVSPAVLGEVSTAATPGELDAVAAQARALREWFRGFVAKHRGKPLTRRALADLEPLNRLLARDEEFGRIAPKDKGAGEGLAFALVSERRWRSADALLFPIAKALAELVTASDFTDVKHCEGSGCVLHFLDTTRDRRRRWCSMAVCGNRAKQAALRSRKALEGHRG